MALATLNQALECQKRHDLCAAHLKYEELKRIEIMRVANDSGNPTVNRLKYLTCRNSGMLRLRELIDRNNDRGNKDDDDDDDDEDEEDVEISIYGEIIGSMNDLLNSTLYGDPDTKVVKLLAMLFSHFGHPRLARLCYELKLADSNEADVRMDLDNPQLLLLNQVEILQEYAELLDYLKDTQSRTYFKVKRALAGCAPRLDDLKYGKKKKTVNWDDVLSLKEWKEERTADEEIEIEVDVEDGVVNVNTLLESLVECVPKPKGKNKMMDGYMLTDAIIKKVEFVFHESKRKEQMIVSEQSDKKMDVDVTVEVNCDAKGEQEPRYSEVERASPSEPAVAPASQSTTESEPSPELETEAAHEPASEPASEPAPKLAKVPSESIPEPATAHFETTSEPYQINEMKPDVTQVTAHPAKNSQIIPTIEKPVVDRPTRALRGKGETDTAVHDRSYLQNFDVFIGQTLPSFLKLCDISYQFQLLSPLVEITPENTDTTAACEIDPNTLMFYRSLQTWNDNYSQSLLVESMKPKTGKKEKEADSLSEILNIKSTKFVSSAQFDSISMTHFYEFLKTISTQNLHFNSIRFKIAEYLFQLHEPLKNSIICVNKLSKKASKHFKVIVASLSISYYNDFEKEVFYGSSKNLAPKLNIAISILESVVDAYLDFVKEVKAKRTTHKPTLADFQQTEAIITTQIEKWRDLIEDYFSIHPLQTRSDTEKLLWCRFKWMELIYIQNESTTISTKDHTHYLTQIADILENEEYYIPYVNYENIPVLSLDSIRIQLHKTKMFEIFHHNEKSNEILESVLIGTELHDPKCINIKSQLVNFLADSNLEMTLRLWSLLLSHYRANKKINQYKVAFEKIIVLMAEEVQVDKLKQLPEEKARLKFINALGFFTHFSREFIQFSDEMNFKCFDSDQLKVASVAMVKVVSRLLNIMYAFLIYQKAITETSNISLAIKSSASYEILIDCLSCCFFLLAAYYPSAMKQEDPRVITDILSVCHIELGLRRLCSADGDSFLKLLQYKLTSLDTSVSANDVFQVIHCRYGLPASLDGFETFDHKCRPKKMSLGDAIQLSKFISRFTFNNKKHPAVSPLKGDIKLIIDKIAEVYDGIDTKIPAVEHNQKHIQDYLLDKSITMQFIVDAFNGECKLPLEHPEYPGIEISDAGIHYLEGLMGLHFYKARKRTVQSRASELELIEKNLLNDLWSGSNRFETWVALGQTYSYMVEDDLIWTADKLNSMERKQVTAMSQRKALMCYMMAISIHTKSSDNEKKAHEDVLLIFWNALAKELYGSWMEPMSKKAFHVTPNKEGGETSKVTLFKLRSNDVPTTIILKILELAFKKCSELDSTNWFALMYLSKTQWKIQYQERDAHEMIGHMLTACDLAMKQSNKEDPIIEPHYYLFALVEKCFKERMITLPEAVSYWKKDTLFEPIFEASSVDSLPMEGLALLILKRLISYDKKKWQHRPVFRLAQTYYYAYNDIAKAKEEMLTIINLRPNVRSLSTIWKPASERPGKHFTYNSTYTRFLVKLLFETGDLYSLIILVKKMRRAGSIMVNLSKTFDSMTTRICILIKKSLSLEPGFLDDTISKIKFQDFAHYSTEFAAQFGNDNVYDDETALALFFLSETQILRKLATGFGATGVIDECYYSVYIKMFIPYLFKRLLHKAEWIPLSRLLSLSKDFSIERVVKSKQSTPEPSAKLQDTSKSKEANELPASGSLSTDNHEPLTSKGDANILAPHITEDELSFDEKIAIIQYLSFKDYNFNGTPTKEKIRVARRDISPFAVKIVNNTLKFMETFKQKTNDGEALDYHIKGPLNDAEIEKALVGVFSKETKENKEDKEFEKLTSAHDRSLTSCELLEFNKVLSNYGVKITTPFRTKTEIERQERLELSRIQDLERRQEIERLKNHIRQNLSGTPPALNLSPPVGVTEPMMADEDLQSKDSFNLDQGSSQIKENIPNQTAHPELSRETVKESVSVKEQSVEDTKVTTAALEHRAPSQQAPKPTSKHNLSSIRNTQPAITNFFKTSPLKADLNTIQVSPRRASIPTENESQLEDYTVFEQRDTPEEELRLKRPSDVYQLRDSKRTKAVISGDNHPFRENSTNGSLGFDDFVLSAKDQVNKSPVASPRRNSRRNPAALIELGSHGSVEQKNVKAMRDKELLAEAESLPSSDQEDSIIVID